MTRFIQNILAVIALSVLLLPGQAAAQNGETVTATHGDWEIRCGEGEEKLCVMVQVGKNAEGKAVLEVRIRKLTDQKTADGKNIPAVIQIQTPLATILKAGVRVSIDGAEPRSGPFEICVRNGCYVREPMSDDFLAKLKAGSSATVSFTMLQQGEVTSNLSLKGFTKAFGAL